jgi:hypothetical protein
MHRPSLTKSKDSHSITYRRGPNLLYLVHCCEITVRTDAICSDKTVSILAEILLIKVNTLNTIKHKRTIKIVQATENIIFRYVTEKILKHPLLRTNT